MVFKVTLVSALAPFGLVEVGGAELDNQKQYFCQVKIVCWFYLWLSAIDS